jgi:predicted HicB family RNase H-like nuclease
MDQAKALTGEYADQPISANKQGYTAHGEIDPDTNIICSFAFNSQDVITFRSKTIEEARKTFQD